MQLFDLHQTRTSFVVCPTQQLRLLTPELNLSTYTFNKKMIKHRFCAVCGCGPLGEGVNPKTNSAMAAVNVRCLDGVDLASRKRVKLDGKSL